MNGNYGIVEPESANLLSRIQDIEYEALCFLSNVCEANDFRLFLRGGSVLGAIKYGGFVPWDDDIDVALPRDDYNGLIQSAPRKHGDFLFVAYQDNPDAHCYFPRIILNNEACDRMRLPKNNVLGLVLVDVLPIDGMPAGSIAIKIHKTRALCYRFLASIHTLDVKENMNLHKGARAMLQSAFHRVGVQRLYSQDDMYQRMDDLYSRYAYNSSEFAGMLASSKLDKEIMPTDFWGNGASVRFRDLSILVPTNYDYYLCKLFGEDWVTTEPAQEQRTKSHVKR